MILNESNFQETVIASTKPVVVDFWAPWCGPCNAMMPRINDLVQELEGRFIVGKVNVDEEKVLSEKYNISSIPCFIFFKDGQETSRLYGLQSGEEIQKELEKLE